MLAVYTIDTIIRKTVKYIMNIELNKVSLNLLSVHYLFALQQMEIMPLLFTHNQ